MKGPKNIGPCRPFRWAYWAQLSGSFMGWVSINPSNIYAQIIHPIISGNFWILIKPYIELSWVLNPKVYLFVCCYRQLSHTLSINIFNVSKFSNLLALFPYPFFLLPRLPTCIPPMNSLKLPWKKQNHSWQ